MKALPSSVLTFTLAAGLLAASVSAGAQSVCSSDGQPRPAQLLERFINANCESCWSDPATPKAGAGQLALDWVVPGDKGDDAPLSAVATRDGLLRLEARRQPLPAAALALNSPAAGLKGARLRIAHGLALTGYLGTSIELKPLPAAARGKRWSGWLALVETLPSGTEGSPVERKLVRNLLQVDWNGAAQPAPKRFFDARSMRIAEGVNPERLQLIGWVEDDAGKILAAAQSACIPEKN